MKKPLQSVVRNESEKTAQIFLYGIIGDYWSDSPLTAKAFVRQLTSLQGQGYKRVDVRLNGPGGDVWEGLGILNAMKTSSMDIHTYNDGICASMHGVIFAGAKSGNRHLAKASVFMIHNASTLAWGNSQVMRETADFLDTHDHVLISVFSDATGKPAKEIQDEYFDYKDHWLTAQEVEALGIGKVEDFEAQDVPKDIKNMSLQQVAALYNPEIPVTQLNNHDMSLISINNKFKGLSALAKVAAEDITADQLKAVNDEIEAEGIKGLTVVLDADLQETVEAAGKVEGLQASITAKDGEIQTLKAELQKEKDAKTALQKKLDNASEDPAAPPASGNDEVPGDGKKDEEEKTPQDVEMANINALMNLIP